MTDPRTFSERANTPSPGPPSKKARPNTPPEEAPLNANSQQNQQQNGQEVLNNLTLSQEPNGQDLNRLQSPKDIDAETPQQESSSEVVIPDDAEIVITDDDEGEGETKNDDTADGFSVEVVSNDPSQDRDERVFNSYLQQDEQINPNEISLSDIERQNSDLERDLFDSDTSPKRQVSPRDVLAGQLGSEMVVEEKIGHP